MSKLKGAKLILREPRTKTSNKLISIDIDDDVVNVLKRRSKQQKEDKLRLSDEYDNEHNLVFARDNGDPYFPDYISKSFRRLADKVGLEDFRLHDLRHTHATLMLEAGVHREIVQERLGHSSITQTLDTYSHITPNMQEKAVQKLKK